MRRCQSHTIRPRAVSRLGRGRGELWFGLGLGTSLVHGRRRIRPTAARNGPQSPHVRFHQPGRARPIPCLGRRRQSSRDVGRQGFPPPALLVARTEHAVHLVCKEELVCSYRHGITAVQMTRSVVSVKRCNTRSNSVLLDVRVKIKGLCVSDDHIVTWSSGEILVSGGAPHIAVGQLNYIHHPAQMGQPVLIFR